MPFDASPSRPRFWREGPPPSGGNDREVGRNKGEKASKVEFARRDQMPYCRSGVTQSSAAVNAATMDHKALVATLPKDERHGSTPCRMPPACPAGHLALIAGFGLDRGRLAALALALVGQGIAKEHEATHKTPFADRGGCHEWVGRIMGFVIREPVRMVPLLPPCPPPPHQYPRQRPEPLAPARDMAAAYLTHISACPIGGAWRQTVTNARGHDPALRAKTRPLPIRRRLMLMGYALCASAHRWSRRRGSWWLPCLLGQPFWALPSGRTWPRAIVANMLAKHPHHIHQPYGALGVEHALSRRTTGAGPFHQLPALQNRHMRGHHRVTAGMPASPPTIWWPLRPSIVSRAPKV